MSPRLQPISSELVKPNLTGIATLGRLCGTNCSPQQIGDIYEAANKMVEATYRNYPETTMLTFTFFWPPTPSDLRPIFETQVRCSIAEEPVEAGYPHPAEAILARAVINQPREVIEWLERLLTDEKNYSLVGDILICFAHAVEKRPQAWAYNLAEKALLSSSITVRDSAAQALELWGRQDALRILKKHDESVGWLKKYIEDVIELLESA